MFGYIRPVKGELKVRELEHFKACYCGLCHALGEKYGVAARFILSFELVFLAMLLWEETQKPNIKTRRCIASPCRKKICCTRNTALDACASYSVILSWWKIRDSIADERFIKSVPYRLAALLLRGAYKKASAEYPAFDGEVRMRLSELSAAEASGNKPVSGGAEETAEQFPAREVSLDGLADKFALILSAAAQTLDSEAKSRPLTELLYHTGRWIYIIDAFDDYKQDAYAKRFNPIAIRYPPESGGELSREATERINTTLMHSNNLVCSAFELLPENPWTQTVRNIVYLGMPDICGRVLSGTWKRRKKRRNMDKEWS